MSKVTTVTCHAWAPKAQNKPRQVSRVLCVEMTEDYCPECPNSLFVVKLPVRGEAKVSCPRWNQGSRLSGAPPSEYVPVRRETCLTRRPFEYCASCPNSQSEEPARLKPGWWSKENK